MSSNTKLHHYHIKYHLDNLLKWQETSGLEIIRIVTLGNRVQMTDGTFNFNATRYHFILLDEILKMIPADSAESFEVSFEKVVEVLKDKFQPTEKRRDYHPNHKIQKAINTIITKIETVFALNIEAKSDPIKSCERLLREANKKVEQLCIEWKEQKAREGAIDNFERLMASCEGNEELFSNFNKESELPLES